MKRDLNLMRQIMLDLEATDNFSVDLSSLYPKKSVDEYFNIAWHLRLLADAEYIVLGTPIMMGYPNYPITFITNKGYEFIRLTKDPTIWERLLPYLVKAGGIASVSIIQKAIEKLAS